MTHAALGGVYELLVQYTLFIKDAAMMYNKANTTRVECCVSGPDLMDTVLKHDFMTCTMIWMKLCHVAWRKYVLVFPLLTKVALWMVNLQ